MTGFVSLTFYEISQKPFTNHYQQQEMRQCFS